MRLVLGLDLGTTSLSAVAVSDTGALALRRTCANPGTMAGLAPGFAEQDPAAIRSAALALLRDIVRDAPGNPVALCLTGQMHGGLLIDSARRPLTRLITWQDRRANAAWPGGSHTFLDEFRRRCDEAAIERTGCTPSPGYLAVTLFTLLNQKAIPTDAARAVTIADWLTAEMCDIAPVTDRSNAAATGVFDVPGDCWSSELLAAGGLPATIFPEVGDSGAVVGLLSPEVAAETGLPAGMPVGNAIGDNQAAVLGSVPSGDPAIQINVGTGGQINWPVADFVRLDGMDTRPLPLRRLMLVGAGLSGGDSYQWVKNTAGAWLAAFGMDVDDATLFETINRLAARVPCNADGLACEPAFRGTRRQPAIRGSFRGITFDNFTPGHVARAVLSGIAAGMKWFYDHAGAARPEQLRRIIGSGNGLRRNPLLVQAMADTFERDVWLPTHEEEAAYGAALLAGVMCGIWPDLDAAGAGIQLELAATASGREAE